MIPVADKRLGKSRNDLLFGGIVFLWESNGMFFPRAEDASNERYIS